MSRTVIISLEGNIGAGKSTLLTRLQHAAEISSRGSQHRPNKVGSKHINIEFVQEPVSRWSNSDNQGGLETNVNLLSCFYADPDKYAFPFQIMAYTTQLDELYKSIKKQPSIVLTERSLESNREIFTKMFRDEGKIDSVHYQIYCENAQTCRALCPHTIATDAVIYLRSSPDVCVERIQKRGREGEERITLDYLKTCHDYHEDWLGNMPAENCLVLDADKDLSFYNLCEILDFMDEVATRIRVSKEVRNNVETTETRHADIYGW